MTILRLAQIMWRWRFAILMVLALTVGLAFWQLSTAPRTYQASVRLQITVPQEEGVAIFDGYRSESASDAAQVARNNFAAVLESAEVYDRVGERLNLDWDTVNYDVEVQNMRDSDFTTVSIIASAPDQAAEIANAHVAAGIEYFGEVRAKPTTATKDFLGEQYAAALQQQQSSKEALTEFRLENNVTTLDSQIASAQNAIIQLRAQRDQEIVERPTSRTLERIDELLVQRRGELDQLIKLEIQYNQLQGAVDQANDEVELIRASFSEAQLKEETIKLVNYIQIIEPASTPNKPIPTNANILMGMAVIAGLVLGLFIALALEFLSMLRATSRQEARPETASDSATGDMPSVGPIS